MNEHEFNDGLRGVYVARTSYPDADAVYREVLAIPVEDIAQQRGWLPPLTGRFQTMFSAAKFVVAGAIVALFGGFLLTGVLTQQGEEPLPGAGATASAEASADTEILSGVELSVEELRPGVFRIFSDGEHNFRNNVRDVAVTPDGDVLVKKYEGPEEKDPRVLRLGKPGREPIDDLPREPVHPCKPAPDGSCWQDLPSGRIEGVTRRDASGEERIFIARDEIGFDGNTPAVDDVEIAEDGTVWVSGTGLASYDGEAWTLVPGYLDPGGWSVKLEVDADGVVWISYLNGWSDDGSLAEVMLRNWDGETWSSFGPVDVWGPFGFDLAPDGTLQVGPLTWFDGIDFRQIDLPMSPDNTDPRLLSASYAPDGAIWVAVGDGEEKTDGLYVITPEAAAATE